MKVLMKIFTTLYVLGLISCGAVGSSGMNGSPSPSAAPSNPIDTTSPAESSGPIPITNNPHPSFYGEDSKYPFPETAPYFDVEAEAVFIENKQKVKIQGQTINIQSQQGQSSLLKIIYQNTGEVKVMFSEANGTFENTFNIVDQNEVQEFFVYTINDEGEKNSEVLALKLYPVTQAKNNNHFTYAKLTIDWDTVSETCFEQIENLNEWESEHFINIQEIKTNPPDDGLEDDVLLGFGTNIFGIPIIGSIDCLKLPELKLFGLCQLSKSELLDFFRKLFPKTLYAAYFIPDFVTHGHGDKFFYQIANQDTMHLPNYYNGLESFGCFNQLDYQLQGFLGRNNDSMIGGNPTFGSFERNFFYIFAGGYFKVQLSGEDCETTCNLKGQWSIDTLPIHYSANRYNTFRDHLDLIPLEQRSQKKIVSPIKKIKVFAENSMNLMTDLSIHVVKIEEDNLKIVKSYDFKKNEMDFESRTSPILYSIKEKMCQLGNLDFTLINDQYFLILSKEACQGPVKVSLYNYLNQVMVDSISLSPDFLFLKEIEKTENGIMALGSGHKDFSKGEPKMALVTIKNDRLSKRTIFYPFEKEVSAKTVGLWNSTHLVSVEGFGSVLYFRIISLRDLIQNFSSKAHFYFPIWKNGFSIHYTDLDLNSFDNLAINPSLNIINYNYTKSDGAKLKFFFFDGLEGLSHSNKLKEFEKEFRESLKLASETKVKFSYANAFLKLKKEFPKVRVIFNQNYLFNISSKKINTSKVSCLQETFVGTHRLRQFSNSGLELETPAYLRIWGPCHPTQYEMYQDNLLISTGDNLYLIRPKEAPTKRKGN